MNRSRVYLSLFVGISLLFSLSTRAADLEDLRQIVRDRYLNLNKPAKDEADRWTTRVADYAYRHGVEDLLPAQRVLAQRIFFERERALENGNRSVHLLWVEADQRMGFTKLSLWLEEMNEPGLKVKSMLNTTLQTGDDLIRAETQAFIAFLDGADLLFIDRMRGDPGVIESFVKNLKALNRKVVVVFSDQDGMLPKLSPFAKSALQVVRLRTGSRASCASGFE